jgi:hypothetical protein
MQVTRLNPNHPEAVLRVLKVPRYEASKPPKFKEFKIIMDSRSRKPTISVMG